MSAEKQETRVSRHNNFMDNTNDQMLPDNEMDIENRHGGTNAPSVDAEADEDFKKRGRKRKDHIEKN